MRKKRGRSDNGPPPPGAWLTTYGDMVTLLLTFFVVLFSMSSIDAQKFQSMLSGLQLSFGMVSGGNTIHDGPGIRGATVLPEPGASVTDLAQIANLYEEVRTFLEEEGLDDAAEAVMEERGVIIRFKDRVLFDTGEAGLRPDGAVIINKLAGFLKNTPNHIRVEGHADNMPINTVRFPSNWELSTARATSVIQYMLSHTQIEPERLSAAGYGQYRPIVPNDTAEHRAQNRRVDIVILRLDLSESEPN